LFSKKHTLKNYILLSYLLFVHFICLGQDYLLDFQHITNDDGLANMHTSTIFKDTEGFLWISTTYGLNRYDGYEFKLFTKKDGLFKNEDIFRIEEDELQNLWLFYKNSQKNHTLEAIDIFNPHTGIVTPIQAYIKDGIPFDFKNIPSSIPKSNTGQIWLNDTKGQIFLYKNGTFKKVFDGHNGNKSTTLVETNDTLRVSYGKELIQLDKTRKIFCRDTFPFNISEIWVNNNGIKVSLSHTINRIQNLSIWTKDKEDEVFQPFIFNNSNELFNNNLFGAFAHYDENGFWYLQGKNLLKQEYYFKVYDDNGNEILDIKKTTRSDLYSEISNPLNDHSDTWFPMLGILKTGISKNPFEVIHQHETLSDSRGITEDEKGNIYFINKNVYVLRQGEQLPEKVSDSFVGFVLIYKDSILQSNGNSYAISDLRINLRTGKETRNIAPKGYFPALSYLKMEAPNTYLFGNLKGLSYFDFKKNEAFPFQAYNNFNNLQNIPVYHFHVNASGIWLATGEGVFLMKKDEGIIRQFNTENGDLPHNHIKHIYEDPAGDFWLASKGGGVIKWTPSMQDDRPSTYLQFTTTEGLSNNFTYAIYADEFGNLWIPSDNGLMQMDMATFQINTYLEEDGLPHNEFNTSSHYKAKDGTLYFGGLGGIIRFHPKDLANKNKFNAPIHLTSFHIWEDGKVKMTDKTDNFRVDPSIEVHPGDKVFELKFALLDFDNPENHHYSYRIEGFDDREQVIKDNYLRITNLPYGSYNLKIKGRNIKKGWSNQELNIPVYVLKPFYLQWWFIGLLILTGIGLASTIIAQRERRLRKEGERLEIEVKNRTRIIEQQKEELKKLDKAKTRFFSNITHEFRTPLTLILGPSIQLSQNNDLPIAERRKLWNISKSAQQLLSLVNQMLDISKIEGGHMQIEISKGEIVSFVKELTEQFVPLAEKKNQTIHFVSSISNWETHFDKDKLNKILSNLLSNALKFSKKEGSVELFLDKTEDNKILIKVEDNGIGISPSQLGQVFNRFYQVDSTATRLNEGTGIGLSLVNELVDLLDGQIEVSSKLEKGTKFKLLLPVLEVTEKLSLFGGDEIQNTPEPALSSALVEQAQTIPISKLSSKKNTKLDLLIIEDNEGIHDYIRTCINTERYNIITAFDGQEGIDKALELVPDLIISDVMMPKKDGFDVITAVRENLKTSHIPMILLTAKSSLKNRLQGLSRGADAYLTKPFSPRELALRVDKLIEIRQKLQERYQGELALSKEEPFQKEDAFVLKIRNYIIDNIERSDLNGDVIGKHFGISRMQIYRKLKALTNKSISEIIKEIRLKKAMELLQDKSNDLNITEVAYKTGFSSIYYFSRSFKDTFGKNPSEI